MNFFSRTEYEKLQEDKEAFKELMPLLRNLNREEQQILIHKIKNSNRTLGDTYCSSYLTDMTFQTLEEKLAKISEDENFNSKNRYRL